MPAQFDATMQELLAQEDFVRALARHLIDAERVDDLIQDTWLTALRSQTVVREPRLWLAKVLRRLASNHRRGDARRQSRERHTLSTEVAEALSTAEILAREEVRGQVVAAVLALREPFRATVLARYYQCLTSDQIAVRDGIAVATVRSRLKRGLDQLRIDLDAVHGGQRLAWAGPLAFFAEPANASAMVVPTAAPAAKPILLCASALLLVGLGIWGASQLHATYTERSEVADAPGVGVAALAPDTEKLSLPMPMPMRVASAPSDATVPVAEWAIPYPVVDTPIDEVAVRVIDALDLQPVPGVTITFLPVLIDMTHAQARGDQSLHEQRGQPQFLERFGQRTTTNEHGVATVRLPRSGGRVMASFGDRFEVAWVTPANMLPSGRFELRLRADRWLRLRLVHPDSRTPVQNEMLEVIWSGAAPSMVASDKSTDMVGPSDEDGIVRVRQPRTMRSLQVRPWTIGDSPVTNLDVAEAVDDAIDVPCPMTGSVTVELRTPSGLLWPSPIGARMEPVQRPGSSSPISGPIMWCGAEPGIYRFAHVSIGRDYEVATSAGFVFDTSSRATVRGPSRSGEDVRVVLTVNHEPCMLAAKLQLKSGGPLPSGLQATVYYHHDGRHHEAASMPIDARDRIVWAVTPGLPAAGSIVLHSSYGHAKRHLECAWHLPTLAVGGSHDLGALTVSDPDVLLAGSVDIGDEPWRGSALRLVVEEPSAADGWQKLSELDVEPDQSREFVIRKQSRAPQLRASLAAARDHLGARPIVVANGTRDLRLKVRRGVKLQARVLAPQAYSHSVRCRAVRDHGPPLTTSDADAFAGDEQEPRELADLVDFDGVATTFQWPALPPGSYRIEVFVPGMAEPLAAVDGVQLVDAESRDPRLQAIDVRKAGRLLTVRVAPSWSSPHSISAGGVLTFPSGGGDATKHGMMFDAAGIARPLVDSGPVDLVVALPGHRLWRAAGVVADVVYVEPQPCIEVPFRLAKEAADRLSGFRVELRLIPTSDDAAPDPSTVFLRAGERDPAATPSLLGLRGVVGTGQGALADAAMAEFSVPVADVGCYRLELWVGDGTGSYCMNGLVLPGRADLDPKQVTVAGDGDARTTINIPDHMITKAVAYLARRR